jgi:hypothetical protein
VSVRTGALLATALAVASTATGCSVIFGWNDLGEGSAAGGDAAAGSSGAVGTDAAPAAEAGDGAPPSLCAAPHDLCDDFSSQTFPDLSRWTTLESGGPSTAARATDTFVSPPASFAVTTVDADSVALMKSLSGPIKRLVCDFSINATLVPGNKQVFHAFSVEAHPVASSPVTFHRVSFSTVPTDYGTLGELWSTAAGSDGYSAGPATIPQGVWVRVRFDLAVGPPAIVTLSYNGGLVGSLELKKLPVFDALLVRLGAMTEYQAVGGSAHFDDVVCDATR